MMIERSVYFANGKAYNINQTVEHLVDMHYRSVVDFPEVFFNACLTELMNMKFSPIVLDDDQMIEPHTGTFMTREEWFLMWGIGDSTFEYFDGQDADSIATFPVDNDAFPMETAGDITDYQERVLVEGSIEFPIEIDDVPEGIEFLDPLDLSDSN